MSSISVLASEGRALQVTADLDTEVVEDGGVDTVHLADLVAELVLRPMKEKNPELRVKPGKYTLLLLASLVGEEDE